MLGRIQKTSAEAILRDNWREDSRAEMILRGAVEPLKVAGFPGSSTVTKLMLLAPDSAFTDILDLGDKIDPTGVSQFSIASLRSFSDAVFIEEGFPIPTAQGVFEGQLIGPVRKLALIAPVTNELENLSAPAASVLISRLLKNSVSTGGEKVLLSADPETAAAPAGLRFGVPPIAAGASAAEDHKALLAAISAAGVSTRSVVLIVASDLFAAFETLQWPNFKRKVIEAKTLTNGTIVALAADGFVVAGEGEPVVDASSQSTLHLANPASQIGTPATAPDPNVVAAPTVSMFQIDAFSLRCIARVTWSVAPGCIAWIENATW
ncbi:hypothetical protein I6F20_17040 [Bradyrhizobium sp. IC3123]|uniref:hypothetical protein n=1 Tax=Bradyrhizobium sp. IC3123 TaxID=2793803 RepID=UPI001CD50F9B|nr:hypothetical protein [Bradyrhizobium sp. IC3123]MCA1390774.1 hypothetical protein [Bradyrhizobium sp. IC3123]